MNLGDGVGDGVLVLFMAEILGRKPKMLKPMPSAVVRHLRLLCGRGHNNISGAISRHSHSNNAIGVGDDADAFTTQRTTFGVIETRRRRTS
jgi:hypothetical protein